MTHQITSTNLHLRPDAIKLAEEKIGKIERVISDVGVDLTDIRVVINKGPRFGFVAKVELWIPSSSFVSKGGGFTIEAALDEAVYELVRQVKKHKGKLSEKDRKLIRKLKNFLFLYESQV